VKKTKILVAMCFNVGLVVALAGNSHAYPPFLVKAKKFGAKDCTFCHLNAEGGPGWNQRGEWLRTEKQRRGVDEVDVEWLADYKPNNGQGSSGETAAALSPTDQQFVGLEQQWMDAVVKRDQGALDRIMGDEFTLASAYSTGERTSKAQFMKNVLQSVKGQEFIFHDSHADLYGDVAVFKSRVKSKYTFDQDDRTGDYLITDVWVNRDGRWQVVSRHSSLPVKAPPKG
jgi:hypothetical protein